MTDYSDQRRKGEFSGGKTEPWLAHCLAEIDRAMASGRRLSEWERGFMVTIRDIVKRGLGLSTKQASALNKIYGRLTDPKPLKYGNRVRV